MPESHRAARAADALVAARAWLADRVPGGWSRRVDGAVAAVTGIDVHTLNGVWLPTTDLTAVPSLLGEVAATGLPHNVQFPTGADASRSALTGLVRDDDVPLMVLEAAPRAASPGALVIRRLAPAEAPRHAEVAARGFGAPVEIFAALTSPPVSDESALAFYVGEIDGVPVVTGLGVRLGDSVGIFNVATPPEHRRRGYGAALTARIVADARADGAGWAWLQSSDDGLGVYERLGFETVATWECWISA